jgi:putative peptidoglycan lipid II flippase
MRQLLRPGLTLAFGVLTAKLALAAQEILIAKRFGVSEPAEVLQASFTIVSFLVTTIGLSLVSAAVPAYVRTQRTSEQSRALFGSVCALAFSVGAGAAILIALCSPWMLRITVPDFRGMKLTLTAHVLRLLALAIPLNALFYSTVALLNARRRFVGAALAPALPPVFTCLYLSTSAAPDLKSVALFFVVGTTAQCVVGVFLAWREGYWMFAKGAEIAALRQVVIEYGPMAGGAALGASNLVIDQAMASLLGPGNVAVLTYGCRIGSFVLIVSGSALGTVLLPYFSEIVSGSVVPDVSRRLARVVGATLLGSLVLMVPLIVSSESLVRFAFEGGAFVANNTRLVAAVQRLHFLSIPGYLLTIVAQRLISALSRSRLLMWSALLSGLLNITFDWLLMRTLGVPGIALASAFVYAITSAGLLLSAFHRLRRLETW